MRSIKEIFVIGHGPSSSHTMGPAFACDYILKKYQNPRQITIILYGSLALTGKGHLTDYIIDLKFKNIPHEIIFDSETKKEHPNTMLFKVVDEKGQLQEEPVISIGGGTIVTKGEDALLEKDVYPHNSLKEILAFCDKEKISLVDYVLRYEDKDIIDYFKKIYEAMEECRSRGISASGYLPGPLHIKRKARSMYENMRKSPNGKTDTAMNVSITAFAVAEENAAGGVVVIAPTCGSAGVIPGAITYLRMHSYEMKEIIDGLLVAGLIGIIAKTNGSVSGAEAGCQAEIGVACSMAAAMISVAKGYDNLKIAQAAEIALEHSLGLTCDPVLGYVQIPCIERCAVFALKAVTSSTLAGLIPCEDAKVDFDTIIKTMIQTGRDIPKGYRETSVAGLAKNIN